MPLNIKEYTLNHNDKAPSILLTLGVMRSLGCAVPWRSELASPGDQVLLWLSWYPSQRCR